MNLITRLPEMDSRGQLEDWSGNAFSAGTDDRLPVQIRLKDKSVQKRMVVNAANRLIHKGTV